MSEIHIRPRAKGRDDLVLCRKGDREFFDSQELIDEDQRGSIRYRRVKECFEIVDRPLWLESLTEKQRAEIKAWYQSWLDAPDTLVVPEKPSFIK